MLAQLSPIESAEQSFVKANYEAAEKGFQGILNNPFATPRDIALSQCRLGIIFSIRNKNEDAKKYLRDAVTSNALAKSVVGLCQYALLQLYVMNQQNAEARDLIKKMDDLNFSAVYVARVEAISAEVGRRLSDNRFEALHLQRLLSVMEKNKLPVVEIKILGNKRISQEEVKRRIGAEPDSTVTAQLDVAKSAPRESAVMPKPVIAEPARGIPQQMSAPSTLAEKIVADLQLGKNTEALGALAQLSQQNVAGGAFRARGLAIPLAQLEGRLKRLSIDKARDMRVGVILPLGRAYLRFNHKILQAVSAFANSNAASGVNFSFVVKGVKPETGAADEAAYQLILEEHVHAIVGPISSSQVLGASSLAHVFSVPLFALGPVVDAPEMASNALVRMGILARSQAAAVVANLAEDPSAQSTAVLAPSDPYGFEMASAFSTAAEGKNLKVTGRVFYDPSTSVFKPTVEELIGPSNTEDRKEEFEQLAADLRKKAELEKRKFDPSEVKLPTRLAFQSLFVPDSLAKARIISSTFAFFDAPSIRYYGDKQWSEGVGKPSLADEFLYAARVPTLADGTFLAFLQKEIGGDSKLDLERQAFDALIMLRQAQYMSAGNNGGKLVSVMHDPQFRVEGTAHYGFVDHTGEPQAQMVLMSFRNGRLLQEQLQWRSATR